MSVVDHFLSLLSLVAIVVGFSMLFKEHHRAALVAVLLGYCIECVRNLLPGGCP